MNDVYEFSNLPKIKLVDLDAHSVKNIVLALETEHHVERFCRYDVIRDDEDRSVDKELWVTVTTVVRPQDVYRVSIKQVDDYIDWSHVSPRYRYMARPSSADTSVLYTEKPVYNNYWDVWKTDKHSLSTLGFSSYKKGNKKGSESLVIRPDGM